MWAVVHPPAAGSASSAGCVEPEPPRRERGQLYRNDQPGSERSTSKKTAATPHQSTSMPPLNPIREGGAVAAFERDKFSLTSFNTCVQPPSAASPRRSRASGGAFGGFLTGLLPFSDSWCIGVPLPVPAPFLPLRLPFCLPLGAAAGSSAPGIGSLFLPACALIVYRVSP